MNNKIVFVLDHALKEYRIPFFEQLVDRGYLITVIHPGPILSDVKSIMQESSRSVKLFGGIEYRKYDKIDAVDVIVHMQNIRIINLWLLTLNPFRKDKIIHWGIGTSSSKGLSLKKTLISRFRGFLSRYASAVILYSDYPISLFPHAVQKKLFIANNTVYNPKMSDFSSNNKKSFLFIGTLNSRKGLDDLIVSFSNLIKQIQTNNIYLNIIGDGPEKEHLKKLCINLNIDKKVNFLGQISSSQEKEKYFKEAIACISPKQAGLSVLESFSYGVPFIAYKDAISGGEHLNIKSGYNGYLLNDKEDLTNSMKIMVEDKVLSVNLGTNAFDYYRSKRQMKHMVDVFDSTFKYVLK